MPTDPKPLLQLCAAATKGPYFLDRSDPSSNDLYPTIYKDGDNTKKRYAMIAQISTWSGEPHMMPQAEANAELIRRIASPEVAAKVYQALTGCDKAFTSWQLGQIPGRPEDILKLTTIVREALNLLDGKTT